VRILQVMPSLNRAFGGPLNSGRAVAEAYTRFAEVHTVSLGSGQDIAWQGPSTMTAYRGFRVLFQNPHVATFSPGLLRHVRRHVHEYDLVHVHLNRSAGLLPVGAMLARRQAPPLVVQTHGMLRPWSGVRSVVDSLATRHVLEGAAVVLTLNPAESAQLSARYDGLSLRVLPNAVAGIDGHGSPADERVVRHAADDQPLILFCARLHPRKGLLTFLAACKILGSDGRRLRIVVAGEDEGMRANAERYAKDNALTVDFVGGLVHTEVERLMAEATVLVHPAPHEPFGMSMLEAFARRLPVVAAPTSELAPLFLERDAATMPESETPEAYARAIASVLDDGALRSRRVARAFDLVHREFSIDALERHLREVVRSVLGCPRSSS